MDDFFKLKDKGNERKFCFLIPTPWDGCAIFNYIVHYGIPFTPNTRQAMPPKELETLLKLCLKYVYEDLPGKPHVVDEDGNIGIITNGNDAPMVSTIAAKYMIFFLDWWQGAGL